MVATGSGFQPSGRRPGSTCRWWMALRSITDLNLSDSERWTGAPGRKRVGFITHLGGQLDPPSPGLEMSALTVEHFKSCRRPQMTSALGGTRGDCQVARRKDFGLFGHHARSRNVSCSLPGETCSPPATSGLTISPTGADPERPQACLFRAQIRLKFCWPETLATSGFMFFSPTHRPDVRRCIGAARAQMEHCPAMPVEAGSAREANTVILRYQKAEPMVSRRR